MREQLARAFGVARHLLVRTWVGLVLGAVLIGTSWFYESSSDQTQDVIEDVISTNVDNLTSLPGWSSLLTSMLLPAGSYWYYVLLVVLAVSGCQWFVGALRALFAFVIGNVGATLVLFPVLLIGINVGWFGESLRYTDDYGVSYALMSVLACTAMLPRSIWAQLVWWVLTIVVLIPFTTSSWGTYTMYGHLLATLFGVGTGYFYRRSGSIRWIQESAGG